MIDKLRPSEARLFLAYLSRQEGETFKDLARRAGIKDTATLFVAYDQLIAQGFIKIYNHIEYPTFYTQEMEPDPPQPPVHRTVLPYPSAITRITKAKTLE